MKVCTKCKENKELEEFSNKKASKDGKAAQCKACRNTVQNARYANLTPEARDEAKAERKVRYENLTPEAKDEEKAKRNARYANLTPEERAKHKAQWEVYGKKPEAKAKKNAASKARRANETPEKKAKKNAERKVRYETEKQERTDYLMKTFDKLKSEVDGTIYHFEINGVYKMGKALYGFDNRYHKHVQKKATQITEWVMNEEQMDAFEKIILEKTKDTQYVGDDVLPNTGNREIRTNDNEQLIDDLLADLNVNFVKLKR